MQDVLKQLKGKLIVSCQAYEDSPLYGPETMARIAKAAELGGAAGIRACWKDDIVAIKKVTELPIIGINKVVSKSTNILQDVIITPNVEAAREVCDVGIDILGLDCTPRGRGYEDIKKLIAEIKSMYPTILIMADISNLEEGIRAAEIGADIVSTTLSGYTPDSKQGEGPDLDLIRNLSQSVDKPINGEGKFWTSEEVIKAFELGAWTVTIGSAISRPEVITHKFTKAIEEYWKRKDG